MLVTDWLHETTVAKYTDHHHSTGDNKPPALLVNGVGRFKLFGNDTDEPFYMKTAQFDVEKVCGCLFYCFFVFSYSSFYVPTVGSLFYS